MEDLPGGEDTDTFQIEWWDNRNQTASMYDFGDRLYEKGLEIGKEPPYMYGAYQMYKADDVNQQYQLISWLNLTSQDAAGLYPVFAYEAILKTATRNIDFKLKFRSTPYPPTDMVRSSLKVTSTNTIVFVSAIAYSMMIVAVVSYLVVERTNGLKHLQVISGM